MPAKKKATKKKLNKKELEHFRKKVLAERERILKELGRIEKSIEAASENGDVSPGLLKRPFSHLELRDRNAM